MGSFCVNCLLKCQKSEVRLPSMVSLQCVIIGSPTRLVARDQAAYPGM
jgi:hypothetical protein